MDAAGIHHVVSLFPEELSCVVLLFATVSMTRGSASGSNQAHFFNRQVPRDGNNEEAMTMPGCLSEQNYSMRLCPVQRIKSLFYLPVVSGARFEDGPTLLPVDVLKVYGAH